MVRSFGCAGILAIIGFIVASPFAFFIEANHWWEYLLPSLMTATFTFLAAILLIARDIGRANASIKEVQFRLNSRAPCDSERFLEEPIACSDEIIVMTRDAISEFFDVSPDRIHRNDKLDEIYNARDFEPDLYFFVINLVLDKQIGRSIAYDIEPSKIEVVDDLALFINRLIMKAKGL